MVEARPTDIRNNPFVDEEHYTDGSRLYTFIEIDEKIELIDVETGKSKPLMDGRNSFRRIEDLTPYENDPRYREFLKCFP